MKKAFLIGAGFSYELGMPLAAELSEIFFRIIPDNLSVKFGQRISIQNPFGDDRPINKAAILDSLERYKLHGSRKSNYEKYISELEELSEAHGCTQSDRDSYHLMRGIFYGYIYELLTIFQIHSFGDIYKENIQWYEKFRQQFAENESWIFSLNHDLNIELMLAKYKVPFSFGFQESIAFPINNQKLDERLLYKCTQRGQYNIESPGFIRSKFGINIVKLHGGLTEFEYGERELICDLNHADPSESAIMANFLKYNSMCYVVDGLRVPDSKDSCISDIQGNLDIIAKAMLTGGRKYSTTLNPKKFEEKLAIFDSIIKETEILTIIGYGFCDQHINSRLTKAMAINNELKIQIVDPSIREIPECIAAYNYDGRVNRAMCGAGDWCEYYENKQWNSERRIQLNLLPEKRKQLIAKVEKAFNKRPFRFVNPEAVFDM